MSDYDSPWKEALGLWFEAFLRFFYADIHAAIAWTRGYELLDKELQAILPAAEHGKRYVDRLVKVWLRDRDEPVWVLIHVEVQVEPEAAFAQRMYLYHNRLYDFHAAELVSLAVLADDSPTWHPREYRYERWGCEAKLRFRTVKLLDYTGQEERLAQDDNRFATVVLAHLRALATRGDPTRRLNWKKRLVRSLYEHGWSADDVRQMFRIIDWMMDLPEPEMREFDIDVAAYEKERAMPYVTSIERTALEKGKLEGRHEGLLEGLEAMLQLKFGLAGLALMPELQQIKDLSRLKAIKDAIFTTDTVEALRRLWSQPTAE